MRLVQRVRRLLMKLRGKDADFISFVLFLRKPRMLSQQMLEQALEQAWPIEKPQKSPDKFVVINGPRIFVKAQGNLFTIASGSRPYIEDPEAFAKQTKDLRIREAVLQHKAWISVDNLKGTRPIVSDVDGQYAQAAKLAAELVDEDCLGICLPGEKIIVGSSPNLAENLRNFESVRKFSKVSRPAPVVALSDEFEEQAKAEAKRRLPEFIKAFEARKAGDVFLVKRRFDDGEHTEWMWVQVQTAEGDRYFGPLENDPLWIKGLVRGDGVRVESEAIEDWVYLVEGKAIGGFSMPKNSEGLAE